jgi:hypothetical protein
MPRRGREIAGRGAAPGQGRGAAGPVRAADPGHVRPSFAAAFYEPAAPPRATPERMKIHRSRESRPPPRQNRTREGFGLGRGPEPGPPGGRPTAAQRSQTRPTGAAEATQTGDSAPAAAQLPKGCYPLQAADTPRPPPHPYPAPATPAGPPLTGATADAGRLQPGRHDRLQHTALRRRSVGGVCRMDAQPSTQSLRRDFGRIVRR